MFSDKYMQYIIDIFLLFSLMNTKIRKKEIISQLSQGVLPHW